MTTGPIIIVDDDPDDHFIASEAIHELGMPNEVISFFTCEEALEWLMLHMSEQPFIIICDVNMPKMDGMSLKRSIEGTPELKRKSIPFVYYSTAASRNIINEAYELQVQGFFTKGQTISEVGRIFKMIFTYWQECKHPNS